MMDVQVEECIGNNDKNGNKEKVKGLPDESTDWREAWEKAETKTREILSRARKNPGRFDLRSRVGVDESRYCNGKVNEVGPSVK